MYILTIGKGTSSFFGSRLKMRLAHKGTHSIPKGTSQLLKAHMIIHIYSSYKLTTTKLPTAVY